MGIISFQNSLSPLKKIIILLVITASYCAAFFLLYPAYGTMAAGVGLLPVLTTSFLFGKKGTVISTLAVIFIGLVLLMINNYDFSSPRAIEKILIGNTLILVSALVLGWTSGLLKRLQQQNEMLAKERQHLATEIEKRKASESNLLKQQEFNETIQQSLVLLSKSRDQTSVLESILHQIKKNIVCDSISLVLIKDDQLEILANVGSGCDAQIIGTKVPLNANSVNPGVCVIQKKAPITLVNAFKHPGWENIPGFPPVQTWLGVPLLLDNIAISVIGIDRFTLQPFTASEIQLLQAFSRPIALTIENRRLYQKAQQEIGERNRASTRLKKRLQSESLINSMATQLLNMDIADIETNIYEILENLGEFINAERSYLTFLAPDHHTIKHDFTWTNNQVLLRKPNDQVEDLKQLKWTYHKLSKFETIFIPDINNLENDALYEKERWQKFGIQSILIIPIVQNKTLLGLVGFQTENHKANWSQEDIGLLQLSANFLGNFWTRRTAERENIEKLLFVESLLDAIPTPLFSIDLEGHYLSCNTAFSHLYEVEKEGLIGKTAFDFNSKEEAEEMLNLDFSIMEKGNPVSYEVTANIYDNSTRILMVHKAPFFDYEGNTAGLIAILMDLTAQKELEKTIEDERSSLADKVRQQTMELQKTNDELARAVKAKDEFLAAMSHELRTPLNAILGLSEALQEELYGPLTNKQEQSLSRIQESGTHLLELISDILDLAKIGADRMQLELTPVDVKNICESSINIVRNMAEQKQLTIKMVLDPEVKIISADGRRLRQILLNLLSNAVKFTPENGEVSLELVGDIENQLAHFNIIDNGIGIAKQDLPYIFTPFQQIDSSLSRKYEGAGLGLALAAKMTQLHNGTITVESQPHKGSHFCVSLPWNMKEDQLLLTKTEPQNNPNQLNSPSCSSPSQTVLIAEDNQDNSDTIADYLQAKGFRTLNAFNGYQAIEMAKSNKPNLILMDIQMPELDGIEAIIEIRKDPALTNIPIIAITALAMSGDCERCLRAGANDYLSKPFQLNKLLKSITHLINDHPEFK